MTYIDLINAFEQWLETNYLPNLAQLLWYKLIRLFNKAKWSEWITVDNLRLMSIMQIESEKTFIRYRDKLVEMNFFEYQKGKKGSPNRYKILTVNFTVQMPVQMGVKTTVQMPVQMTANVSNINRIRQDKEKEIITDADVIKCYEDNIGLLTPATAEILFSYDDIDRKLIIYAIKKASIQNKKSTRYIQGILNNWIKKGIKTVLEAEQEEEEYKTKNNKKDTDNILKRMEEKFENED